MNVSLQRRTEEVSSVLNFYHEKFTAYLATTIAFTEKLPEEINNQIRDAFTHLARANVLTSEDEIAGECKLAIGHIERANRDCLKACIIKTREELDNLLNDVAFHHGFPSPAIKTASDRIKIERKATYRAEAAGANDITQRLEEILRLTMDLCDEIRTHYSVAGKTRTRLGRWIRSWFKPLWTVIALLIGAIVGSVIRGEINKFL